MAASSTQQREYPPLLTPDQAAELYAVTRRTIDRWMADGTLPADARIIVGGSTRYRTVVLLDHINAQGCVSDAS